MKRLIRKSRVLVSLVLVVAMLLIGVVPTFGANPTVTMTVTAGLISITNTQATWALGIVLVDEVVYFSADGSQDDNYSQIENTGTLPVDVEIQGTDFEGGDYDWTLAAAAGDQTYSLYANSANGSATYDIEIKSSSYNDLTTDLEASGLWDWSANFTAPSAFNVADDGGEKTATITLVASEHV